MLSKKEEKERERRKGDHKLVGKSCYGAGTNVPNGHKNPQARECDLNASRGLSKRGGNEPYNGRHRKRVAD